MMVASRCPAASWVRRLPCFCSRSFASTSYRAPTIFAPATGRGKAAISILRISGDDALQVWRRMTILPARFKRKIEMSDPIARKAELRTIVHPETREVLDEGIVVFFPASAALTGQPTLELHVHGSPALMDLLLRLLPLLSPDFRIAEPGEFTRLAFEAGKMDLTEVEGLRDLVEADTEEQRKLATRQASGQMRKTYDRMRSSVIDAIALVEALIDFGEDEGISTEVFDQAKEKVRALRALITKQLDDGRRGEIIRSGIHLAILGAPNVGKSSLLNFLVQREAAIVTSTPGTTRDVIELALDFHGFPIRVADTAGLRSTEDVVESIGIERAQERARTADLKLCVLSLPEVFGSSGLGIPHIDAQTRELVDADTIIVLNKTDAFQLTGDHREAIQATLHGTSVDPDFAEISLKTGAGLDTLVEKLTGVLKRRFDLSDNVEETPLVTQARHRKHLEECLSSLTAFLGTSGPYFNFLPLTTDQDFEGDDIVLAAEELRYAVLALGRITGAVDVEEVLGEIFRGFCIGK